jgi:hypothetical protein
MPGNLVAERTLHSMIAGTAPTCLKFDIAAFLVELVGDSLIQLF